MRKTPSPPSCVRGLWAGAGHYRCILRLKSRLRGVMPFVTVCSGRCRSGSGQMRNQHLRGRESGTCVSASASSVSSASRHSATLAGWTRASSLRSTRSGCIRRWGNGSRSRYIARSTPISGTKSPTSLTRGTILGVSQVMKTCPADRTTLCAGTLRPLPTRHRQREGSRPTGP